MTPEEFEQIFHEHGPLVWAMIRRYGPRGSDIEDLFMEIWEAVWVALPRFSGKSKLSTFIAAVARKKCSGYFRRRGPFRPDGRGSLRKGPEERSPGFSGSIRKEAGRIIGETLEELPPLRRRIMGLWMMGYRYREIAELLNAAGTDSVDENFVGKQLYLARIRIAEILKSKGIKKFDDIWE